MDDLMRMLAGTGVHLFHAAAPSRLHFETVEPGGEGAGGETGGETAVIDAEPVEATEVVEPAAGTEQQLSGLTREEMLELSREGSGQAFREMMAEAERQELAEAERRAAQQRAQAANELPPWDPFNPDVVRAYNQAQFREMLAPIVEAITPAIDNAEQVRLNEGRDQALEILDGFKEEIGEFDHDRTILQAARYQSQGMEPEAALERAAREQATWEASIESRGVEKFKTPAQNLADTSAEPAGGSGAAAEIANQHPGTPLGKLSYREQAEATLARIRGGKGVGVPTG